MILDTRLKLANNLDIAASSRVIAGVKQGDLFKAIDHKEYGRGHQLFCCVTVRESFDTPAFTYVKMSLREEWFSIQSEIEGPILSTLGAAFARTAHDLQPVLGATGYIQLSGLGVNNFSAGKKITFAISPITNDPYLTVNGTGDVKYQGGTYSYFYLEEFSRAGPFDTVFAPSSNITAGKIDVDIVAVAEGGAGANFNDVRSYPTRTIVR